MAITADRLLEGIKRRIIVPSSQSLFSDTDFFAFADDIISSRIVPLLESVNQEFFVTRTSTPLVASQSIYSIPYRAIGRSLRELKISDSNDNVRNIALISIEDAHVFNPNSLTCGFYFLGDKIHLVPDVPSSISGSQSLDIWYRLPPSKLVASSSAAFVVSVSSPDVVVTSVPSGMVTGSVIDFVQGRSGNSIYEIDKTITNIAGTTITFDPADIPDDLAAGDFIAMAGYSPVVNFVPNECYSLIESLTAKRVLTSQGDFEGAARLEEDISEETKNIKMILEPRIDGEPTIIINRYSLARGNKYRQRSWIYGQ